MAKGNDVRIGWLIATLLWLVATTAGAAGIVVEYVNTEDFPGAPGGHYFYSTDPAEQAAVDAGAAGKFRRTGLVFYTGGETTTSRFFGSVTPGPNSHFFTANAAECASLRAQQVTPTPTTVKQWNYEGVGFAVAATLPNGGCPAGAIPVHRAYNNGAQRGIDSNHRFSTAKDALTALAANLGWTYEGVVFCTILPQGQAPLLSEALDCGALATAGGLGDADLPAPLKYVAIDLARFPDAVCNDGSAASMYYRPFVGAANQDKWVIQLQGGGSCETAGDCAKRWCSVDTNYGMTQMSSNHSPKRAIDGRGIEARASEDPQAGANPLDGYNHVYLHYCSSDTWAGTARDSTFTAAHPVTGAPVAMRAHFLGQKIIDGALGMLRRDGVAALTYGQGAQAVTMPDLDNADEVVFAGASAGGAGIINNLDRVRGLLAATNARCAGASCPLQVRGLIDSIFSISALDLDFSQSTYCRDHGVCTGEAFLRQKQTAGSGALQKSRRDQSCLDTLTPLGTEWKCWDNTYQLTNHVTTPFFVRMGLIDENISADQIEPALALPGQGVLTLQSWGLKVRDNLVALSSLKSTAVEKSAVAIAPGAFGPLCAKHETLSNDGATYGTSIRVNGVGWKFFDVWNKWVAGQAPQVVVSSSLADTTCAE
jgi:hypothetical protein